MLETEYNSKPRVEGYNTNSLKIGNSPEDDLEDGKIFAVMHRSCPQLLMHSTKRVHDALQIADAVGKMTNKPPLEKSVPTSHAKVPTVTQLLEMNAVKRYVQLVGCCFFSNHCIASHTKQCFTFFQHTDQKQLSMK